MLYCVWYDAVFVKMMLVVIRITLKLDHHIECMFVKIVIIAGFEGLLSHKSCRIPFVTQIIGTNTQFRWTWIRAVRGRRACVRDKDNCIMQGLNVDW